MKRTWIPPTVVFPAIAVGLLVLAFLYYYFPERIRREDALNRQAFRQLGTVSDSIQSAVSSYGAVLERWANAARSGDQSGNKMTGFADQVPDLRYVSLRSDLPSKTSPVARPPAPLGDCTLQLSARSEFGQVLLHFECGEDGAEIPLETLVQRYIKGDPQETFDEFLLADTTGNVFYQTTRTGLHLRNVATLLAAKGDDKKSDDKGASAAKPVGGVQQASDVVKLSLGGAAYRLYSSPAPIRLSAADTTPALDLVLYGLVSEENVVPYSWNIHKSGDAEAQRLAYAIERQLSEFDEDCEGLRRGLREAMLPFPESPVAENRYGNPSLTPEINAEVAMNAAA